MAPLALGTVTTIALIAGAVVAAAFAGALIAIRLRGRPRPGPDIPPGMAPGPSDEVLERRQLERVMGWGVVFVLFFATWIPLYWLNEPGTNVDDELHLAENAVERGRQWFEVASEENPTGFGCARCHGAQAEGGQVPFTEEDGNQVLYPVPPLKDVCGGSEYEHPLIESLEDIRTTIEEGRPGTPMPSWSVRFQGPMNDQQITDLILYLVSIQDVPQEDNLCLQTAGASTGAPEEGEETGGGTEQQDGGTGEEGS